MKILLLVLSLSLLTMCNSDNKKEISFIELPKNSILNLKQTKIFFEKKVKIIELPKELEDTLISFPFENIGKNPLLISKAVSSCGCTITSYPKDTIFPNKKNEIKLRFKPRKSTLEKDGIQQSTVEIFGNFTDSVISLNIIAKMKK
ncbi:MAG: DUF1573 domain-containing protein [Flavobacteriales bacterium]|jgi:hypothetical protein